MMKQRLKDLWKEGAHICLVPGSTGELAKVRVKGLELLSRRVSFCHLEAVNDPKVSFKM